MLLQLGDELLRSLDPVGERWVVTRIGPRETRLSLDRGLVLAPDRVVPCPDTQNPPPAAPTTGSQVIHPAERAPTGTDAPALGESPVLETMDGSGGTRKSWQTHLSA